MQFVVEDSTNANERAILVEGWNLLDPPAPIDISAVTLLVSVNGDATPDNADGTLTRLGTTHLHRFVFNNSTQFQAFAAGDVGALIVPHSTTGDGRMGLSFPFYISAGNPGSESPTAETIANEVETRELTVSTTSVTSIRNAILNWEPYTGYTLARLLRAMGIVIRGTAAVTTTSATFTAPAGGTTVTATVDNGNRTVVNDTASNTP